MFQEHQMLMKTCVITRIITRVAIHSPSQKNNLRAHPYSHNNGKPSRPYQGVCFGCHEKGHSFANCRKISDLQKEDIVKNFETHLKKYREERSTIPLNFSGVTPLPQ